MMKLLVQYNIHLNFRIVIRNGTLFSLLEVERTRHQFFFPDMCTFKKGDRIVNKSGVFLVIFILLLGIVVVPIGPDFSATKIKPNSSVDTAALASTGTLKIIVAEDAGVLNGSYADTNFGGDSQLYLGTGDEGVWVAARSYLKFDLIQLPSEMSVQRATMNVFVDEEWVSAGGVDEPVGVYYCTNNTWD